MRARFIRYWGEEHTFSSPANIKDMWEQIFIEISYPGDKDLTAITVLYKGITREKIIWLGHELAKACICRSYRIGN